MKNADLCLIEYKIVHCSIDCVKNVTQIGFIRIDTAHNHQAHRSARSAETAYRSPYLGRLCMDSSLGTKAFRINATCKEIQCVAEDGERPYDNGGCFYWTPTFWLFVILMCIGTIGFNVSNCVSDATCFDMLTDQPMHYGGQRVWGTIGFGLTALMGGISVHIFQLDSTNAVAAITPALIIMLIFGICDMFSIKWLELPRFTSADKTVVSKVIAMLKQKEILIFLCFATLAGIIDSFIIYYMFWYLEEIAQQTGHMDRIKLIEGKGDIKVKLTN